MTKSVVIYIAMIMLHILEDFHLQGILAQMKQKSWWQDAVKTNRLYKNDYLAALFVHGFEWAFIVMLPMLWQTYCDPSGMRIMIYLIGLFANMGVHAKTDDMKANQHKINLIEDQARHMLQIFITWAFWTTAYGW